MAVPVPAVHPAQAVLDVKLVSWERSSAGTITARVRIEGIPDDLVVEWIRRSGTIAAHWGIKRAGVSNRLTLNAKITAALDNHIVEHAAADNNLDYRLLRSALEPQEWPERQG